MKLSTKEGCADMNAVDVLAELEALGTERTKKSYLASGALEPLFGTATGKMKPILKKTGLNQTLADELYDTKNYDAMYFAGIIAEPNNMTAADYERWMDGAYFNMLADYVVAVTLAEADIAEEVADRWIHSEDALRMSAGWSCYCWMLGNRKDETFNEAQISMLLDLAKETIHEAPNQARSAMNNFIKTVGISYKPLHEKALAVAKEVGAVELKRAGKKSTFLEPLSAIEKEVEKGRIGFKRKHVRC